MLKRFIDKKVDRDWLNTNFPCMMACPAHTNAGRYVALIAEGRFEEAYRFARDPNPLASICGRVCAHPCETACRRGSIDKPIAIRALKRFLTERYGPESRHPVETRPEPAAKLPFKVAVVGSGPVGLPSLEHIAEKTSREWIYAWIKDPQAYSISATMPNFGLSDDDTRDLSAFLIAQSTPLPNFIPAGAGGAKAGSQESAAPDAGTSLYGEAFCASCHAMQNRAGMLVGGDLGPELTRIGSKVNSEWLKAWLSDPARYDPETLMPHYRFTAQQVSVLAGFLAGKTDSDLLSNVHLPEPTARQVEHGKLLAAEDGCAACHRINGIKPPENFAPALSRIGSKPLVQLAFAEGVAHTLPDYIAAKIRNPRAFGSTLKMPQFKLSAPQIDALTTALLALSDRARTLPASLRLASGGPSHYEPAGQAGRLMNDLRCFSCHAINGRGGDMAPDLSWEGSSVQRKWLVDFLKNPNTLRPALGKSPHMPPYGYTLSKTDLQALVAYMRAVSGPPYHSPGLVYVKN